MYRMITLIFLLILFSGVRQITQRYMCFSWVDELRAVDASLFSHSGGMPAQRTTTLVIDVPAIFLPPGYPYRPPAVAAGISEGQDGQISGKVLREGPE